ncbi:hypothetical protein MMC21_002212 [Puttea exsequens]|nr:hypothetical protein [Puttea exsequens]
MSGIQTHTQDPINTAKVSSATTQTVSDAKAPQPTLTSAASNGYPFAQPGAAAPTPTRPATIAAQEPPSPRPRAIPAPQPSTITAKATLPPPPKAGETARPVEHYNSTPLHPAQPQQYPYQMSQPPLTPNPKGIPSGSTTSTTSTPSYTTQTSLEAPARASLEHPPGYVQNPYASDMTPTQRLAQEQQENDSTSLGYNDYGITSKAAGGEEGGLWDMASKGLRKAGEEASKLHGKIWNSLGDK